MLHGRIDQFMDRLTHTIIAILRRDGRISYSDIARELKTSRDFVASRINPLIQSGELRVIAAPHPRVLGLTVSAHFSIKVSGAIDPIAEALGRLESIIFMSITAGAHQLVVESQLANMTDLRQQISMIRALDGVTELQIMVYERILKSFFLEEEPEFSNYNFDDTDINIISLLQQDGRAGYADIAQKVGLSLSGCRTRIQRLLGSGMMQIGAIKLRSDMTDDFLFGIGINVNGSDPGEAVKLLGADPGLEFMARTVGRFDLVATVNFDSLLDFNRLISLLRALPSVAYCEQWLHVKILRERYDHTVEERKDQALKITDDSQ
jgi:DNA-binding Lrp family transcriptional regulator